MNGIGVLFVDAPCGTPKWALSVGEWLSDEYVCVCLAVCVQELIRDQPMPALTAVQQLQLQQLQDQQAQLMSQQQTAVLLAQQQQAAALVSQQQQQAAQSLQLLQQQQQLLCAAAGSYGSYMQQTASGMFGPTR